ncbi:MAG: ArnT family glycosyltransferase [Chloroflexota bacterium]
MLPDWLSTTLQTLPAILWVILGMGVPWALVALPRADWRDRVMVACLSLGFGPALLTAWMFVLGTLGQDNTPGAGDSPNPMQTRMVTHVGGENLMRPDLILAGTVVIAVVGLLLAWRKSRRTQPTAAAFTSLAPDEKVLIALIAVATAARWLITSWLGFGSYDPLWVYGYQGRIYTLLGYIPQDIGYYPQFLSLQYAFGQMMLTGGINDHAARAVLPFLQIGSILATYLLGSRLFNRRTGIFAAALWALYPHFGYWTRVGDLEIPVTFTFTAAAAFFLMAWTHQERFYRRRYAAIAGLFLGIAMWTKPTAGAFIWGVILAVIIAFITAGFNWRRWLPRFEVAAITGLACLPLGALWYVRNILIGHAAVNFPPSYWLTQAMRSGQEFGWPLLALAALLAYLFLGPFRYRPNARWTLIGCALIAGGIVPTILEPARMGLVEWAALLIGTAVITLTLGDHALAHLGRIGQRNLQLIGWASVLALPYFITWFYSYSYHYRLSFPIVPLLLLPTAVILAAWITPARVAGWRFARRLGYAALVIGLGLPAVAVSAYDANLGWDWLWTIPEDDDFSEAALLAVVDYFEDYIEAHEEPPVILAPGFQTLPFFFPTVDIRIAQTPLDLHALDGVTHFISSNEARQLYGANVPPQSALFAGLRRENVATGPVIFQDHAFSYEIYSVDTARRFQPPADMPDVILEDEVIFGDFARLVGYSFSSDTFTYAPDAPSLHFVFEVLAPVDDDYFIYVHLVPANSPETWLAGADGPVRADFYAPVYYSTRDWEPGEYIIERRLFWYDPIGSSGDDFRLRMGFYSQTDGHRAPVTVNGAPVGDGYMLPTPVSVPEPPG